MATDNSLPYQHSSKYLPLCSEENFWVNYTFNYTRLVNEISPSKSFSWINILVDPGKTVQSINQSDTRDTISVNLQFRLKTRVRDSMPFFSFPSDFRDNLLVGLG